MSEPENPYQRIEGVIMLTDCPKCNGMGTEETLVQNLEAITKSDGSHAIGLVHYRGRPCQNCEGMGHFHRVVTLLIPKDALK